MPPLPRAFARGPSPCSGMRRKGSKPCVPMKLFADLLDRLIYTPSRNTKIALISEYFRAAPDPDRGWASPPSPATSNSGT